MRPRRRPARRRQAPRRPRHDGFQQLVQHVTLAGASIGVVYGQAEMLGEPWRHVLAVGCVVVLVAAAIWMKRT